jgi:hypothetical protein
MVPASLTMYLACYVGHMFLLIIYDKAKLLDCHAIQSKVNRYQVTGQLIPD